MSVAGRGSMKEKKGDFITARHYYAPRNFFLYPFFLKPL
jgi:hypothetical protein